MKGKDWKFNGYAPDIDDDIAERIASSSYFGLDPLPDNSSILPMDTFAAGFYRGIRWALDKQISDVVNEESE